MTKLSPKISIIIATYNAGSTLDRCLESIRKQKYNNYEVIIVDGLSSDDTVSVIKNYNELMIKWISEKDSGIYDAWNKGIALSTGEWIWFLGADDSFYSNQSLNFIANSLASVADHIDIVYSKVMWVNHKNEEIFSVGEAWEASKVTILNHMCIPHQGVLHRRRIFERGLFNTSFRIAGDYELLLRELPHNEAIFLPEVTVRMSIGGVSSNPKSSLRAVKEIRKAQKLHGQKIPSIHVILALLRAYIRITIFYVLGEPLSKKIMDLYRKSVGKEPYWYKS